MYLILVFLPLLGTISAGFFGRWLGGEGAVRVTFGAVITSFLLSLFAFFEVGFNGSPVLIRIAPWFSTEVYDLSWGFLFDPLTCVRLVVVTSISTLVHLYSSEYMGQDPHLPRFRAYLSFFTFFRLILVTSDNLLQMFVGWEGVGLCSYLLINFWYGRLQANKAAIKAMVINRIGDIGMALAIFSSYYLFQSLDYAVMFGLAPAYSEVTVPFLGFPVSALDRIGFFLLIGAVGKSAQIGLHTWLPDAREGPTPVSALIHAATRVTAGVFLLCRCSPLLAFAPSISTLITIVGGMTAFLAATTGLLQNDLKRVIAYSTCSQLGYIVFAAGLSAYSVSRFHLYNHAFFKALLFLGAGSVIHARADEQDIRRIGGLVNILPFTYTAILVGSLALRGFPFLTGFYSKDVILEAAYGSFIIEGRFVHTLGILAAFFTAFYSMRLLALTFLRPANGNRIAYIGAHESPIRRALPLFILSFASIFIGYLSRDRIIGIGSDFFGQALFSSPQKQPRLEGEWLDSGIKLLPLVFSLSGAALASYLYLYQFESLHSLLQNNFARSLYTFLNRKWFFDKVYAEWVSQPILRVAYTQAYQLRDRGLLEFLGPQGLSTQAYFLSNKLASASIGFVYRILFLFLISIIGILVVFVNWHLILTFIDLRLITVLVLFLIATI